MNRPTLEPIEGVEVMNYALDLNSLTPWLGRRIPDLDASAAPQVQLMAGGRSNLTFALTDASGHRFALRRPPLGHVMHKAHDMAREFRVLSGLRRVDFLVPDAQALCEDISVLGAPFLVMSFVEGMTLSDADDTAQLSPEQADAVSRTLIGTLSTLHRVDVEAAGLSDFGRPSGYLNRQVALWRRQWETTKTRELAEIERLAAWLSAAVGKVPTGLPWSLVHGDYRLDNTILDPELHQLRAVLDWEMSTLGDPVADLAIALVYRIEVDDGLRRSVPVGQDATTAPGFWTRNRILDEYVARTEFDIGHLQFCVALACYKLAVIMESIHFRTLAGQQRRAAAERQENMGTATEALALLGLSVIEHGAVEGLRA